MKTKISKVIPHIATSFLKGVLYNESFSASSVLCFELKTPDNLKKFKKNCSQMRK